MEPVGSNRLESRRIVGATRVAGLWSLAKEKETMLTKHPLGNDPLLPPSNELRKEILDQRIVRPLRRLLLPLLIPRLLHLPLLIRKRIRILPRGERYDLSTPVSFNTVL